MPTTKPNIVVFLSHDTGRHVSPYGVETVHTPAYNRVACEGVTFVNCFCTSPQCSPSRASLFTGLYPHTNGVYGLTHKGSGEMHAQVLHISHHLKRLGYDTAAFGVVHECKDKSRLAYDMYLPDPQSQPITDNFNQWLDNRGERHAPFFCSIGTEATHLNWPNDPDTEHGLTIPDWLNDGPLTRDAMARLQADVRELDGTLGRVIEALETRGQLDNTLLIITTDHGLPVPRAKCSLFDAGVGILMMMRWPGFLPADYRTTALMSNVDVVPTVLEAVGAPADLPGRNELQGVSMLPQLQGQSEEEPRSDVFIEHTIQFYYDPARGVRTNRYKYVRYFEHGPGVHIPGDVTSQGYFVEQIKPAQTPLRHAAEELYDLHADPLETSNLADDESYAQILTDLRSRVAKWMRDTKDPLLEGPIASPYFQANVQTMSDT